MKTLVVGGEFTRRNGAPHVTERCWRMVRIFSDALADPVFVRREVVAGDERQFSSPFPAELPLVPSEAAPERPPWKRAWPDVPWDRRWHERLIDDVDAVYCRIPPHWSHLHLFERARARGKIVFASFHGDWAGVYEHLARESPFPRSRLYARLARRVDAAMRRVATASRVLFCVGPELTARYGPLAPVAVDFANYLHRDADIHARVDTCESPPHRVLFVGNLEPRKGAGHLVEAVAAGVGRGIPYELDIVGAGEERAGLEARAHGLGIGGAVRFHGYVPFGAELLAHYRRADVFVLPAMAGEGQPKVTVEAMSQGLPVVATEVGSAGHVVRSAGAGLVVPPGDTDALGAALDRMVAESDLRRRCIRDGLAFARRNTTERQRERVHAALAEHLPELVGPIGGEVRPSR